MPEGGLYGRLLIGLPFAMSGLSKLAAYGPTTEMIAAVGLPAPPLAFAVAVAVELGGGLLLIAGFQTRLVATALTLHFRFQKVAAKGLHSIHHGDDIGWMYLYRLDAMRFVWR
jgi:putative oxidoreductase